MKMINSIKNWFDNDILTYQQYEEGNQDLEIIKLLKSNKTILSLGCAGGREVKELVKKNSKIIAVDFSKDMIESSKKIEPNAEYYCEDVIKFLKRDKRKFDYILGISSLITYLDTQKKRDVFFNEIKKKMKKNSEIILTAHFYFREWKGDIKTIIAPFIALILWDKDYRFGDGYCNRMGYLVRTHCYSRRVINNYFKGFNIRYNNLKYKIEIRIIKGRIGEEQMTCS